MSRMIEYMYMLISKIRFSFYNVWHSALLLFSPVFPVLVGSPASMVHGDRSSGLIKWKEETGWD